MKLPNVIPFPFSSNPEALSTDTPEKNMAHIGVIGGLLSFKTQYPLYVPLLSGRECTLSAKARFFPIPGRGLIPLEEMHGRLEEDLIATYERLEERLVIAGHSLGALMANMLALDHPDKISDVVDLAGVHDGIKHDTPTTIGVRSLLRNPPEGDNLWYDSDAMMDLREKVATAWSPDTRLHIIAPTYDDMIPAPQGLQVQLPDGQEPKRRMVNGPLLGTSLLLKRLPGMPKDTRFLWSPLPASHYDMPLNLGVLNYVRKVRREAVLEGEPDMPEREPIVANAIKRLSTELPAAA